MALEKTVLNITSKNSKGKKIEQAIGGANPNASDADLATFATSFQGLSKNLLVGLHKTQTSGIELPNND